MHLQFVHKAKTSRKISPRLFCEELVEEIIIGSRSNYLPDHVLRISDKTVAAITKAALGLRQDFTEENVKSYRLWDVK